MVHFEKIASFRHIHNHKSYARGLKPQGHKQIGDNVVLYRIYIYVAAVFWAHNVFAHKGSDQAYSEKSRKQVRANTQNK